MQHPGKPPRHQKNTLRSNPTYAGKGDYFKLPEPVKVKYFKDEAKTILDPALLGQGARDEALSFKDLKSTQMRRFFDEIKAIERKVMSGKDLSARRQNFEKNLALIAMLNAKAVYAEKRKVAPPTFTQFVFNHVASIGELEDFNAFVKVFEAVVAYHKYFAKDN